MKPGERERERNGEEGEGGRCGREKQTASFLIRVPVSFSHAHLFFFPEGTRIRIICSVVFYSSHTFSLVLIGRKCFF